VNNNELYFVKLFLASNNTTFSNQILSHAPYNSEMLTYKPLTSNTIEDMELRKDI
jgi:hypothetical protein